MRYDQISSPCRHSRDLENFFVLLRRLLHDWNDFDAVLPATAKSAVVNEVYHELNHAFDICRRANTARIVSRAEGGETLNAVCDVSEFFDSLMDTVHTYARASYPPCEEWFKITGLPDLLHDWLVECEGISSTRAIEQGGDVTVRRKSNRNIIGNVMHTDLDTKTHQTTDRNTTSMKKTMKRTVRLRAINKHNPRPSPTAFRILVFGVQ
jgi:hypothetical protein